VGLWVFLYLGTCYFIVLGVKDEITGAGRDSDILLNEWKLYRRENFGISKITVVY
jgi:hypothetical protein